MAIDVIVCIDLVARPSYATIIQATRALESSYSDVVRVTLESSLGGKMIKTRQKPSLYHFTKHLLSATSHLLSCKAYIVRYKLFIESFISQCSSTNHLLGSAAVLIAGQGNYSTNSGQGK